MQQAHEAIDIMVFDVHATTTRPQLTLHQLHLTSIFHKYQELQLRYNLKPYRMP